MTTTLPAELTVAELAQRFGSLPPHRIRTDVPPGTATEDDVTRLRHDTGVLCELIDGVLVEKAVSEETSGIAMNLGRLLGNFVMPRRLGWLLGADGFARLFGGQLRAPDVSFVRRDQRPQGLVSRGYADGAPALAVEVVSPSNTVEEMEQKRHEYFAAGAELVWIVLPVTQTVQVWTTPQTCTTLGREDQLTGGDLLPGFAVTVGDIFAVAAPDA